MAHLLLRGYEYKEIYKVSLIENLEELEKRNFELYNPNHVIDLKKASKVMLKKYCTETNVYLGNYSDYDLMTIIGMSLEDRFAVMKIIK
jgi:hypothetical protein